MKVIDFYRELGQSISKIDYLCINPNQPGGKRLPWYILLYNLLVTYANFMKFGDVS